MLEKARQIEIDQIVIDWEDAVAPDQKQKARDVTLAALAAQMMLLLWRRVVSSGFGEAPKNP